jgi:hypothetical protein
MGSMLLSPAPDMGAGWGGEASDGFLTPERGFPLLTSPSLGQEVSL